MFSANVESKGGGEYSAQRKFMVMALAPRRQLRICTTNRLQLWLGPTPHAEISPSSATAAVMALACAPRCVSIIAQTCVPCCVAATAQAASYVEWQLWPCPVPHAAYVFCSVETAAETAVRFNEVYQAKAWLGGEGLLKQTEVLKHADVSASKDVCMFW